MSLLAKVFKCCRCQGGDPPDPCMDCCDAGKDFGSESEFCCYGINDTLGVGDTVQNLSHEAAYVWQAPGFEPEEVHASSAVQSGVAWIETSGVNKCEVTIPVDFTLSHHRYEPDGDPIFPQLECGGSAEVTMRIGPFLNAKFWELTEVGSLTNIVATCTEGDVVNIPTYFGAWTSDIPWVQATNDTCEAGSQSMTLSKANGYPKSWNWTASVEALRTTFGCLKEWTGVWDCNCTAGGGG